MLGLMKIVYTLNGNLWAELLSLLPRRVRGNSSIRNWYREREALDLARGAHSAHVSPLDLGSVKDIYLCRPLAGSNRNYSGPRSGLAHDLHIRLKQYPRVSAAVGRFNAAGAPAERRENLSPSTEGRGERRGEGEHRKRHGNGRGQGGGGVRLFQLK